jgi:hypothetical protein
MKLKNANILKIKFKSPILAIQSKSTVMQHQKVFFWAITLMVLSSISANAQINKTKAAKTWESNGLSATPASKNLQNIDLGQGQRLETIAKMEKDEKDLNEQAMVGDGKLSKSENAVLNNIRTLKEPLK